MSHWHTTQSVADLYGQPVWRIRRLFEDGTLKEPGRFAGKRIISAELLPTIAGHLQARGWLNQSTREAGRANATPAIDPAWAIEGDAAIPDAAIKALAALLIEADDVEGGHDE